MTDAEQKTTLLNRRDNAWPFSRLMRHWELGLLMVMILAVFGMVTYLLLPRPQAVIALKPYLSAGTSVAGLPAEENAVEPALGSAMDESGLAGVENAGQQDAAKSKLHKKRSGHHAAHKKPKRPPITSLNSASIAQLQLLPGIGPKMAERIIEYRKTNGKFRAIEQVMEVKGIGPKKFEKMKAFLKV